MSVEAAAGSTGGSTSRSSSRGVEIGSAGLEVDGLTVAYGDAIAVDHVSLSVAPGEIVALLGANGAGKSSLLQAISGLVPAALGSVSVGDTLLDPLPPEERAHYAAHVPEGRRLFPEHTVRENLLLAAYGAERADREARLADAKRVLPRLEELADRRAGLLSGGEQQMVALGRGVMAHAPVLMIDELSLGLAPTVAQQFGVTIRALRDEGYAILVVEQYVTLALTIADRVLVCDHGRIVLQGTVDEVRANVLALEEAYLGSEGTTAAAVIEEEAAEAGIDLDETGTVEKQTIPKEDRANPLLAPIGFLLLNFFLPLPFYKAERYDGKTADFSGWDMPTTWLALVMLFSVVATLISLERIRRGKPLPLGLAMAAAAVGVGVYGSMVQRVWERSGGLPQPYPGASYERQFGLFLAFTIAPMIVLGGISLVRERLATDRLERELAASSEAAS